MPRRAIYLLDASVAIDYLALGDELLGLIGRTLGDLALARPVLVEVEDLDEARCSRLQIRLVAPIVPLLERAGQPRPGLSFQDKVCLELALEEGWTLVTNDLLTTLRPSGLHLRSQLRLLRDRDLEFCRGAPFASSSWASFVPTPAPSARRSPADPPTREDCSESEPIGRCGQVGGLLEPGF